MKFLRIQSAVDAHSDDKFTGELSFRKFRAYRKYRLSVTLFPDPNFAA